MSVKNSSTASWLRFIPPPAPVGRPPDEPSSRRTSHVGSPTAPAPWCWRKELCAGCAWEYELRWETCGWEWPSSGEGVGRSPKSGEREEREGIDEDGEKSAKQNKIKWIRTKLLATRAAGNIRQMSC